MFNLPARYALHLAPASAANVLHGCVVQLHCRLSACAVIVQEAAEAEPVHGIPGLLLADGELLEEQKTSFKLQHSASTVGRSLQG